jgi:hypothetical protein
MTDKKTMLVKLIKFTVLSAFVAAAGSCGLDRKYIERSPATELSTAIVEGGRSLSESEMKVAVRVCFALRSKRNNFNTLLMGNTFSFRMKRTTCATSSTSSDASTVLSQNIDQLYYNTKYTGEFNAVVETDVSGYLSLLCEKVIKGETPVNYYEQGSESREISFSALSLDNDRFTVKVGQKSGSSVNTTKIVVLDVATSVNALGASLIGLIAKETRYLKCNGDPDKYDSLSKSYLP